MLPLPAIFSNSGSSGSRFRGGWKRTIRTHSGETIWRELFGPTAWTRAGEKDKATTQKEESKGV